MEAIDASPAVPYFIGRLLLVSAVRLTRDCLAQAITARGASSVVETAATTSAALECVASCRPDALLVDARGDDGLDAIHVLSAAAPTVPIIALAIGGSDAEILACAEAGAAGYVGLDASLDDVMATVASVIRGESVCSPRVTASLFRRLACLAARARTGPSLVTLTSREREIALLLEQGLSNGDIARRLGIRLPTVKNHVHHILEKLQARRRGEVVAQLRRERTPHDGAPHTRMLHR